ncbi:NADAR domain-containing protein [Comamonas sp. SCN 67-35]|uniref:NADAR domain-containing protein n=1 Tax=Comamonas sp. SCN 67-35 TaxID=1660096 RepID=UPI000ADA2FD1|nr:NADAR domain-containing protein [Comamonas sp. SCN 67-35]
MAERDQTRTYSRKESVVFLKTDEPFGGLSNMAGGYPIHVNGVRILTSEALYQVCRFPHLPDVQKLIIGQVSPMTAKMRSKPYRKDSRPDWDQVRVRIMRWSLRMKLANNWNTFSALLLKTGDRPIVEESRKDAFWGAKVVDDGDTLVGMNVLGRLLMELREQVKQQGRDAALDIAPPDIPQFLLFGRPIEVAVGVPTPQAVEAQEQGSLFGADTAAAVEAVAARAPVAQAKTVYEAYRASGLPWVPHVPEGWQVLRNGRLFGHRVETGYPDLPILEVSLRTGVRVRDMEHGKRKQVMSQKENYKRAVKGDIAYNMMRMWQGAVGPAPVDGLVSPAYVVVKPFAEANSAYYSYLFRTQAYMREVNKFSRGIVADRNRLYWESFKQMPSLVPPRPEQDQIVAYLRAQDAHIARFIKAKRDLIALMAEKRSVLAERAISSADTQYLRLDRVVSLLATPITREPKATYTPIGMFNRGRGIFHKPLTEGKHLGDSTFFRIGKGDLVFSGQFAWEGAIAVASAEDEGCIASHRYPIAKCKLDAVTPEYLYTFFLSKAGDLILNHHSRGAAGRNRPLNPRSLLKEKIPVPPLHRQREVSDFLYEELSVRREIEKEIALIREYRDRLIADAVTGQVDLRGWRPGPDDAVSDDDLAALGDDEAAPTEEDADGEEN